MVKAIHQSYPPVAAAFIRGASEHQIPVGKSGKGQRTPGTHIVTSHWNTTGWKGYDWNEVDVQGQLLYTVVRGLDYVKEVAFVATANEPLRYFVLITTHNKGYKIREFTDTAEAELYFFEQVKRFSE